MVELLVLGVTLVGAVQAVRGVIWFALAAAAILPLPLDGLLTRGDVRATKVNRTISVVSLACLAVALAVTVVRPASYFDSEWSEAQIQAVRQATRDPAVRVFPTDGTADWLLWRIPDLRGRIAYDVRWELYEERALDAVVRYGSREGDWRRMLDGYGVVLVDNRAHLEALQSRATVRYRDSDIAVLALTP